MPARIAITHAIREFDVHCWRRCQSYTLGWCE
jgi:hypothetical protein